MSILLIPPTEPDNSVGVDELPTVSPLSAFFYFITATLVSVIAYVAIAALKRRQEAQIEHPGDIIDTEDEAYDSAGGAILFWVLLAKLKYVAFSVFFTYAVTMIFPVYTQVSSVRTCVLFYNCRINKGVGYCICPPHGDAIPLLPT